MAAFEPETIREKAVACQAENGHAFSDAHSQCRIGWHMEESGTEGMGAAVEAKIQRSAVHDKG